MHLADSAVATNGFWPVVGVLAAGLMALLGDWARRRWRGDKDTPPPTSESVAADTASREILEWVEVNTIKPLRRDLTRLNDRIDKLQAVIEKREAELAEAKAMVTELRAQAQSMEQRLIAKQGQIDVLLRQLGVRNDGPISSS